MSAKTSKELADLFGVSVRQVQRLTLDGIIDAISDERPYRYDLLTVVPQYCAFLTEKAAAQDKNKTLLDLEEEKLRAEVSMKQSKAQVAQMELKELKGKLHRAEDVEAITTDHVLYFRSMLMAMPGKLAVDCAACKTAAEAAERIKQEVYFVLNSLAEYRYDPDEYQTRVRERRGLDALE